LKKKSKGLTLIELIIALALTVVILGIVYTFYLTNSRSLTLVDIQETLHTEGKAIEDKILKIGTEAKGLVSIENASGTDISEYTIKSLALDPTAGTLAVKSLTFKSYNDTATSLVYDATNRKLVTTGNNILSENVESVIVKPLNLNQMSDTDKDTNKVKDLSGYEITIMLKLSKGRVVTTHPVTVIVKFRNKEDLEAEVRKEAKNVQVNIENNLPLATRVTGLKTELGVVNDTNIIGTDLYTKLHGGLTVNINSITFGTVTFVLEDKKLTMQTVEGGVPKETVLSECIKEFKIKSINNSDIKEATMKLKDIPQFQIIGKVELGEGETLTSYPINIKVRFP